MKLNKILIQHPLRTGLNTGFFYLIQNDSRGVFAKIFQTEPINFNTRLSSRKSPSPCCVSTRTCANCTSCRYLPQMPLPAIGFSQTSWLAVL